MPRPTAEEFLVTLLDGLDNLPPDLARRLAEILKQSDADRSQAIRRLFEEFAGE